jgi:hypothetical protein
MDMKSIEEIRIDNLRTVIDTQFNGRQVDFAEAIGIQQPNYVSRMLSGAKGIGSDMCRKIEAVGKKPDFWMDYDHSESHQLELSGLFAESMNATDGTGIAVPLMNAYGSAGVGSDIQPDEVVIDYLRVSRVWLDRNLPNVTSIANIAFIHAIGDSMATTFNDGDILLVDVGVKDIKSDAVYVLEAHDRLFIKRVRQRLDSQYEISSDNPNVKTVDILGGDHQVTIRGRVVWVWNGKRV